MVFLNAEATPMNVRWLKFHFQLTINFETILGHRRWIDVILSMLFQRCLVNVETTSINIRRLNFHFQPNFNVEIAFVHLRWIDVIRRATRIFRGKGGFLEWGNIYKCFMCDKQKKGAAGKNFGLFSPRSLKIAF